MRQNRADGSPDDGVDGGSGKAARSGCCGARRAAAAPPSFPPAAAAAAADAAAASKKASKPNCCAPVGRWMGGCWRRFEGGQSPEELAAGVRCVLMGAASRCKLRLLWVKCVVCALCCMLHVCLWPAQAVGGTTGQRSTCSRQKRHLTIHPFSAPPPLNHPTIPPTPTHPQQN